MPIDLSHARQHQGALPDRRQRRIEMPDCPSCQLPLQVDVRSSNTLYARCQGCGQRLMVAKPPPR